MEEARVRRAPVLALRIGRWVKFEIADERFFRRLDQWLQRYPDVQVEAASTRSSLARYLEGRIGGVQLVVIRGRDETGRPGGWAPTACRYPPTPTALCSPFGVTGSDRGVSRRSRVACTRAADLA